MHLTVTLLLVFCAFVCFVLAALNVPARVNLTALGLAFWAAARLLTGG